MPEEVSVVVASEQVDVLAPPAEIRVSVGVGANGQRGSRFYAGAQSPEVFFASIGESPLVYDLYLNTTTQQMFQLVSTPTGSIWSVLFSMNTLLVESSGYGVFMQETPPALATGQVGLWIQTDSSNNPLGMWVVTGE